MHLQSALQSAVTGPVYGAPSIGGRTLTPQALPQKAVKTQAAAPVTPFLSSRGVSSVAKPAAPFVDASLALPQAGTMAVPLTDEAAGGQAPARRRWWPWVLGAVVVAGAIGGGIYYYQRRKKRSSKRSKA